jgi:hypothetical protein
MDEKSVFDILEKRGVAIRDVRFSLGSSYGDLLRQTINDTHHNFQLIHGPPKPMVRITILIEPLDREEVI